MFYPILLWIGRADYDPDDRMKEKNKTKKSKTKVSTGIAAEEKRQSTETLVGVLRRPRYEVIPLQGAEEVVVEHVPKDIKLTELSEEP